MTVPAGDTDWLLGIDIGTGSVKALAMSLDGDQLASACVEHVMRRPRPGWAENDPEDWLRGVVTAVRQLLEQERVAPRALAGLCVVSQRDPWVLLDSAMQPLRPAISWTDQRSEPDVIDLCERFGRSFLIGHTGVLPIAGLGLPTLRWVQRNEPDIWARTARLLSPKDFVLYRLAGTDQTDVTMPSRSVMNDLAADSWSSFICGGTGIPLTRLPEIAWQPADRVATLPAAGARLLGLEVGVPVAAGGGDDQAATLGAGAFRPGDICAGTGTSSDWRIVRTSGVPDAEYARGDIARHVVDGTFIFEICMESTGSSLRWYRDTFGLGMDPRPAYEDVIRWARRVPPGADGVMFLPFVDGAKRAPWYLQGATGGFVGLASGHTRDHLARAVLEGVAFQYPATLELVAPGRPAGMPVTLVDGEAKSAFWNQIKADVMGTPVRTTASFESAAIGAAILAGQASGVFEDAAEGVKRLVRWGEVFMPDADSHHRYAAIRHEFMRVFGAVRPLYGPSQGRSAEITGPGSKS